MKGPISVVVASASLVALGIGACTISAPHVTPIGTMLVYVEVADSATGQAIDGAAVRYWYTGDQATAATRQTKADGTTAFEVPATVAASHMWVEASGYLPQERHIDAVPSLVVRWRLQRVAPPVARKTREAVRAVQTNFLNLRDDTGHVQFSPFILGMSAARQDDWIANELAAGSTHLVVALDVNGYRAWDHPEAPAAVNYYLADRWRDVDALLGKLRAKSLTPVVFLHSGDTYAGDDYYRGVCRWWLAHWPQDVDQVVFVNGWETRRVGGHTARQWDTSARIMRQELGPTAVLAFHGSPESHTVGDGHGSNPDDPYNGLSEPDEWRTGGLAEIEVLLFQTLYAGELCLDQWGDPCWWNRAGDAAERFLPLGTALPALKGRHAGNPEPRDGTAHPDWFGGTSRARGRPTLVAFEAVGYGYVRGWITDTFVRQTADTLYDMGYRHFGNGQPTRK